MTTIPATELAKWTPVAIDLDSPTPSVEWGDFGSLRFTEPFFDEAVARWAATSRRRTVRTELDALAVLDQAPSLEPSGFIFHMSRCGSTLLTRLLQQISGCVVVSEPAIVNNVLLADEANVDDETRLRLIRLLIRALGRQRFGDERHYVVKLSSWNIRKAALFRSAFPQASLVWLQRKPAEVIASLLGREPEWKALQRTPDLAAALFGMTAEEVKAARPKDFYVGVVTALLTAARGFPPVMRTVDYLDLPEAAWTTVAPHFGMTLDAGEIALMEAQSRFYSKDAGQTVFQGRIEATGGGESIDQLALAKLDSLYRELRGSEASKPGPRQSGV